MKSRWLFIEFCILLNDLKNCLLKGHEKDNNENERKENQIFFNNVKFEENLEQSEGANHADICRKSFPDKDCSMCSGLDGNMLGLF